LIEPQHDLATLTEWFGSADRREPMAESRYSSSPVSDQENDFGQRHSADDSRPARPTQAVTSGSVKVDLSRFVDVARPPDTLPPSFAIASSFSEGEDHASAGSLFGVVLFLLEPVGVRLGG
jgi:hypothetical protein